MEPVESDQLPVFQFLIHPNYSDGEPIIKLFQLIHVENPALAKRLVAVCWVSLGVEAPFSVLPNSEAVLFPSSSATCLS